MIVELNPVKWFRRVPGVAAAAPVAAAVAASIAAVGVSVRRQPQRPADVPFPDVRWRGNIKPSDVVFVESSKSAKAVEDVMSFGGFLKAIGKDFLKGLGWAVQYAVPVVKLVGILFPAASGAAKGVADALSLIQTAAIQVEQKYAAAGIQNGTGTQKAAEVLVLTEQAVIALLKQEGVTADTTYVQQLIDAVVAILNVHSVPVEAQTAAAA